MLETDKFSSALIWLSISSYFCYYTSYDKQNTGWKVLRFDNGGKEVVMLSNCVSLCLIDRHIFDKGKDIKKWSFTSAMNLELIRKTIAVEVK